MMGFQIGVKDIIDILVVAIILYETFRILKRSGAANVFWGIFSFLFVWYVVSYIFNLELTGALFDRIISVGAIALIVIFQDEIRSFFSHLGSRFNMRSLQNRLHANKKQETIDNNIMQIVMACKDMSQSKTGALIVLPQTENLHTYMESGERIDAIINTDLIENIFFKNSPLHDGALFIADGRLHSAGCILPVSKNLDLPKRYGMRHRAALGMTEKSDAIVIIVSEETGRISVAEHDTIHTVNIDELQKTLIRAME